MKTHDTIRSNGSESNGSKDRISSAVLESAGTTIPPADELEASDLRRTERNLKALAEELADALEHLERALLASKKAGFTGRVQDIVDNTQSLQREAARAFGRKVGERLGRESLWQVKKGVEVD
jgi:hypothetical protein